MPFLNRDDISLYYEVYGAGQPLILTHGYSSTSGMWEGQIKPLSKDYQLIIWDMRGHGQTTYPADQSLYSEAHTVADILAILDHIAPNRKAVVGGLSLGGYMSLAFYRRHPERVSKLLIIDTGPGFKSDKAREGWNKTAHQTARNFEEHGLAPLQNASPERSNVTHRNARGLALAAKGMLAQRDNSVILSLPEIKIPAIVVVGSEDTPFLAASEYMKNKIPGSKKVMIAGAGHAANIDRPEEFNQAILDFLQTEKSKL